MLKSELVWEVKSLEYKNTQLNISIDHLKNVEESLEARVKSLETENKNLKFFNERFEIEVRVLKEAFDASERTIQREREEFKLTKDDNSTLKSSITFIANENRNLRKQLADVKLNSHKAITHLNEEVRKHREELKRLRESRSLDSIIDANSKLKEEIHSANKGITRAKGEVEKLYKTVANLMEVKKNSYKVIDELNKEVANLKVINKVLGEGLVKAQLSITDKLYNQKVDGNEQLEVIRKLRIEVKELKEENVQINNLYKARGRSMTRVKEELNKWNSIEEEDKIISRLKG